MCRRREDPVVGAVAQVGCSAHFFVQKQSKRENMSPGEWKREIWSYSGQRSSSTVEAVNRAVPGRAGSGSGCSFRGSVGKFAVSAP